jgi:ABC-2 type transport system permease protein
MIIVPMLIFPLMGMAIGAGMEASEKQLEEMSVAVMNLDAVDGQHNLSDVLYFIMVRQNMTLQTVEDQPVEDAVRWCVDGNLDTLVVIPANFTEAIAAGGSCQVQTYQVLRNYGFTEAAGTQRVNDAIASFNAYLTAERLLDAYPDSSGAALLSPARPYTYSVIEGKVADASPDAVISAMAATSMTMPMVIMMLIIMAGQLAATSVAMEKEQKTLEVLLTLPIRRIYILMGKLAGVVVVSLIATLSYVFGFGYYMSSFQLGDAGADLGAIGLSPEPLGYALMAASLFLSFIAALSLAVLLSAYTQDVRSAQSLMGILYVPVMIPAIILMIVPVEILPGAFQAVIYAIPFSYPILSAKALYTHQYLVVWLGLIYELAFMAAVLFLAAKMFSSEKVLTAKLRFGKKKVQKE